MNKPLIAKINDKFEAALLIIQAGALVAQQVFRKVKEK